ncbi:MAG: ABC transporter ATP-binding protein [Dethiobacter sp.]|jgi:iron(III) transport system ATP-binding protein|nr:ABC transporter ATP-binding protein [Dethiobacter sp.]
MSINLRAENQIAPDLNAQAYVELSGVRKDYAGVTAVHNLTLSITRGEFLSLLGPSGCGKTTTLRLIAGLDCLSGGAIAIDSRLVSTPTLFVPPEQRGVGIVFQDYALFPHMTVFENISFGLYGRSRVLMKRRVEELLELVGLSGEGKKYPHELSGGQRQRVALARSLAPSPSVILLDEPFSNLDAELRTVLRHETKEILKAGGATVILVTHDQEEAFSLSDRVGLLNAGRLEQLGTPYQIYHHPASRFIADFVGKADFIPSTVQGGFIVSKLGRFPYDGPSYPDSAAVELMIRPDDVSIVPDPQGEAVIAEVLFLGADALYCLELPDKTCLHSFGLSAKLMPKGLRVKINVNLAHTIVFPASGS